MVASYLTSVRGNRIRWVLGATLVCALIAINSPAQAQFTGSFQTNLVSGVTSNWVGNGTYVVGSNTVFDLLQIIDNGRLSNGVGFVGYATNGANNAALISGPASVWTNSDPFTLGVTIGFFGPHNQLTVTNGGVVYSYNGGLGLMGSSSNNVALITGAGSAWRIVNELDAGGSGSSNAVIIAAGATVSDVYGLVSYGGSNNSVRVTDNGSVWSTASDLYVGYSGAGNSLVVAAGGTVNNGHGYIGFNAASQANSVIVSSATWQCRGNLYIGYSGSGNALAIGPGGSVNADNVYVGFSPSASGNQLSIIGGSLYVTNAAHNAVLDVRCGQVVVNGGLLQADILIVTNACGHFNRLAGTLVVSNLVLSADLDADGDGLPNTWEQTYGLDPLSSVGNNGTNGDPDGDGQNNFQELLSGTDPTNSASAFRITIVSRETDNLRITWMTGLGKTNALQVSAGITGGYYATNYTSLFTVTNTTGTLNNYLDIGAATNFPSRYYRVRLVP
jgi:T5SS/PEP-CTERM-associated repeat protein